MHHFLNLSYLLFTYKYLAVDKLELELKSQVFTGKKK